MVWVEVSPCGSPPLAAARGRAGWSPRGCLTLHPHTAEPRGGGIFSGSATLTRLTALAFHQLFPLKKASLGADSRGQHMPAHGAGGARRADTPLSLPQA